MNGVNLFEQQALMQKQFQPPAPGRESATASQMMPGQMPLQMPAIMRFIEGANLDQCGKVAIHLSARLFTLEKQHSGMKAANLNEAAHFIADAVLDIEGAMKAENEAPCRCGKCDTCIAARSDEHHDRKRDGLAA